MTLGQRLRQWFKRLVIAAAIGLVCALGLAAGSYLYFSRDLPSVEELKAWRPPQVTKVSCRDGQVCAEFFTERRTWVDIRELPKHVRDAFLAAEDADFYNHHGLDYFGIIRSGVKNVLPGRLRSGASTISQQTCRRLLLSQERTLARKIREWILTPRMEEALSKDEILNLYVNTIYYGQGRYGIEEASLFYFGKHAKNLDVGEAAVIAGTVQSPHLINPLTNIVRAKKRQRYVLGQLWHKGFVPQAVAEKELEKPIVLGPRVTPPVGQYYSEWIRQQLINRYGEDSVMRGGLRVQIAMEPKLQVAAETALRSGLEAVDRRQGYRGPLASVELSRFESLRTLIQQRLAEAGKRRTDEILVADLQPLEKLTAPVEQPADEQEVDVQQDPDEPIPTEDEERVRALPIRTMVEGLDVVGIVVAVDDANATADVDLVGKKARIAFDSVRWARRRVENKLSAAPAKMSDVMAEGDLVRVRLGKAVPATELVEATLSQLPLVQGALVSIDPKDRGVVAMVGGYDFALSKFNRATQAKRQPGSSFKPFVYGAAMVERKVTPITIINDAPFTVRDASTGQSWKPHNFDNKFDGPMTVREALSKSKNTVSVRLIESIGPEAAIDFAQHAGISSVMPKNLTLALGSGEVGVLEAANAYTTLLSQGRKTDAILIMKVSEQSGKVLEEHHAVPEPSIAPELAYLVTSLMRSVVEEGSAVAVLELGRPAAGKTGTASEYRDAWFSGYTTDFVTTAWVGFDNHDPIGPLETGGRAALPIWLDYMKVANRDLPKRDFEVPPGIVQVRIDPQTGKLAGQSVPGRLESFLDGTQPTETAGAQGVIDPNDFVLESTRGGRR